MITSQNQTRINSLDFVAFGTAPLILLENQELRAVSNGALMDFIFFSSGIEERAEKNKLQHSKPSYVSATYFENLHVRKKLKDIASFILR
jgi:hypothetical protein